MEALKSSKTWKPKKIALYAFLGILILYAGVFIYSLVFEQDKLVIDRYNFRQLEKVKTVFKDIPREQYRFTDLKELNEKYNQKIRPIHNCYYTVSTNYFDDYDQNQGTGYIFGFQLESLIYKFRYFGKYYAYPRYDLPYRKVCVRGLGCYDDNKDSFEWTISNPCKEN